MSVYVDPVCQNGWRLGPNCHMYASSPEELHAFAARLGLKRSWFQDKRVPHYDLTVRKHAMALSLGAKQHDRHQAMRYWIKQGWYPRKYL
jgi:hypothetical protein